MCDLLLTALNHITFVSRVAQALYTKLNADITSATDREVEFTLRPLKLELRASSYFSPLFLFSSLIYNTIVSVRAEAGHIAPRMIYLWNNYTIKKKRNSYSFSISPLFGHPNCLSLVLWNNLTVYLLAWATKTPKTKMEEKG